VNASGGSETVTLTINNLPSHDHRTQSEGYGTTCFAIQSGNADGSKVQASVSLGPLNALNGWNGNGVGDTTYTTNNSVVDPFTRLPVGGVAGNGYISVSSDLKSISTNSTGLGQSISILPPYIQVNYIIKY
jgi:microcystin-dependent protein